MDQVLKEVLHYNDVAHVLKTETVSEIVIRSKRNQFDIPGYEAETAEALTQLSIRQKKVSTGLHTDEVIAMSRKSSSEYMQEIPFEIDGWRPINVHRETVVFVTGFNCPAKWALESFGGMLTLGGLASRIVPFVYKWNCGNLVDYWAARKIVYQHEAIDDFILFLKKLSEQGFKIIHIICHSMGANLVCNSVSKFDEVFAKLSERRHSNCSISNLGSLTFLNPETPLKEFRESQFATISQFTKLTTIYGSSNDVALLASETIFSRKKQLGCNINALVKSESALKEVDRYHYHADSDSFSENSEWNYLDLDVVDTTHLDIVTIFNQNIHLARHMYFNVNKFVIDDVTDLLSTCQRAKNREHRLLSLGGNVYGFLAAPSFVVR